jgi:DNA-binding transcriptional ArsR family regulator
MDAALKAIAEPNRREIMRLLANQELSAGEIAKNFSITRSAVSQHIGILKEAKLITERRLGTQRLYRAKPETLGEVRTVLDELWSWGLEDLKQSAEHDERVRRSKN